MRWLEQTIQNSLPTHPYADQFTRGSVADMIHLNLHLPIFTTFHLLMNNTDKIKFDKSIVLAGIQKIKDNGDVLTNLAFPYLPQDVSCSPSPPFFVVIFLEFTV